MGCEPAGWVEVGLGLGQVGVGGLRPARVA